MHRGSMDNVMATIQILARWIDENGYRSSGHVRELTLDCKNPSRLHDHAYRVPS